jgi:hypothetical protein
MATMKLQLSGTQKVVSKLKGMTLGGTGTLHVKVVYTAPYRSHNMLPAVAAQHAEDSQVADAELAGHGERPVYGMPPYVPGTNLPDDVLGQLRLVLSFAPHPTPLLVPVHHVARLCTEEQMPGVGALGVVAPVTDELGFWERSEVESVGEPVGFDSLPTDMQRPIAAAKLAARPRPAPTQRWMQNAFLVDECPKPLHGRTFQSVCRGTGSLVPVVVLATHSLSEIRIATTDHATNFHRVSPLNLYKTLRR